MNDKSHLEEQILGHLKLYRRSGCSVGRDAGTEEAAGSRQA